MRRIVSRLLLHLKIKNCHCFHTNKFSYWGDNGCQNGLCDFLQLHYWHNRTFFSWLYQGEVIHIEVCCLWIVIGRIFFLESNLPFELISWYYSFFLSWKDEIQKTGPLNQLNTASWHTSLVWWPKESLWGGLYTTQYFSTDIRWIKLISLQ